FAAGDIASSSSGAAATAALLDAGNPDAVLALGDNAYSGGSALDYATRYGPTWGAHAFRTRPVAGNHDYDTPGAAGYFGYFGVAAGQTGTGYYSYGLGTWHVIALNSNCKEAGGCAAGSLQEQWLRADLAAHPSSCTLAYWHHPRFSSGKHGSHDAVEPLWQALFDAGADVILTAHDHNYERFAPQGPAGVLDPERGLRQFVVGTGGGSNYPLKLPIANSEVSNDETWGVLELTLRDTGYDWRFVPVAGQTFTDAGSAPCH
ncbi:MAG TPA: metallophosphoesterase, partial [Solirubrobacteraceae bacterium]